MKKRGIGKHISFLVLFSLLVGLFTGLPETGAKAQGEKGLFITDQINWENETPELEPGAEWRDEHWVDLSGMTVALKYAESAQDSGNDITADQITTVKRADGEEYKEDPTVSYHKNESNPALIDFEFKKCGDYRICYTPDGGEESFITLHVELPVVGFYKTQTAGDDAFLGGSELDLADSSNNEFYMIFTPGENRTVTLHAFVINWDEAINVDDYLKYEQISQNVYKVTVNPYSIMGTADGADLAARCIDSDNDNKDDVNYTGYSTRLVYNTDKILWWTDQFKDSSWGENGPGELEDAVEFQKDPIWASRPYSQWIALKYGDTMIKAEQLTVTDINGNPAENVHIFNGSKDGFIGMRFPKTGNYLLLYKEGDKIIAAREVSVNYPDIGYYKGTALSDDGLLTEGYEEDSGYLFQYGKYHNRTFYLLYRDDDENMSISDVQFSTLLHNADGNFAPQQSDYVSGKPLANNKGYEFTVKENMGEEFLLLFTCKKSFKQEDGTTETYDDEAVIFLRPNGLADEPDPTKPETPKTETPKVGTKIKVSGATYQITSLSGGKREVCYVSGNKKATKITVPATVTANGVSYKVTAIADNAFAGYSKLTGVTLSGNITKIGKNAFLRCTKLTKISVPKNVTEIGKNAFKDCKKLSQVTFKGTKIKKIGQNAFKNISKKAAIKVPKNKKTAYKKLLKKSGYKKTVK